MEVICRITRSVVCSASLRIVTWAGDYFPSTHFVPQRTALTKVNCIQKGVGQLKACTSMDYEKAPELHIKLQVTPANGSPNGETDIIELDLATQQWLLDDRLQI